MPCTRANPASNTLSRAMQLRETVLLTFCDPVRIECTCLRHLSRKEWQDLLRWLDTSGLALYFLDRLEEPGLPDILPPPVIARLRQNLADNTERMNEMIAESAAIQLRFQQAGFSYAVLKGFSLWPISVPKVHLRSQCDLDFLVAEAGANEARRILEDFGYRLHASSGGNWDFRADEGRNPTLKDLYKPGMGRSAELHIEPVRAGIAPILSRTEKLRFHGVDMPVLPPVDLLLGQGLHLYKHVCSQFARAAHLVEFRRNVIAHRGDRVFWEKLRQQASGDLTACIRLGLVTLLITRVMGEFAPEAFTNWTVDRLPAPAKLWVDFYGHRIALAAFPGSKLYLLLEAELKTVGLPRKRPLLRALIPRRLPQSIAPAVVGETLRARLERYRAQLFFYMFRLCFSALEGARYLHQSILWRQYRNELSQ